MKKFIKNILYFSLVLSLLFVFTFFTHKFIVSWRLSNAAEASGGLPYQIGLTNVVTIPCFTTGEPPTCEGGTLCTTITDMVRCVLYSDVTGTSAGGSGQPPLLLSNIAIGQAGLSWGGQLIYGGTTNSMYLSTGNTVLASAGGCSGCTVKSGTIDKIYAWLEKIDKFIIAGFREK